MVVRLLCFIKRLPGVDFEEFDKHWSAPHGRLVASLEPLRNGTIKYTQFHTTPAQNDVLTKATLPVMAYDGVAEFEAENLETILGMFFSKEYQEKVAFDEERLGFDRAAVQVMVGRSNVPQPLDS